MKKFAIIFAVAIVLANLIALIALYFVLRPADIFPQFMVITFEDSHRRSRANRWYYALNLSDRELERVNTNRRFSGPANVDAERAVNIAHMIYLDDEHKASVVYACTTPNQGGEPRTIRTVQPYVVYHDIEQEFFIVLAPHYIMFTTPPFRGCADRAFRVIVCGRTGGILSVTRSMRVGSVSALLNYIGWQAIE